MRKLALCFSLWIGFYAIAADRVVTVPEAGIRVIRSELTALPDGGCAVQAFATFPNSGGGAQSEASPQVEVGGANRTVCLDVLNRSLLLFKSSNGF